ncbi:LuxR C-terminal-related transcriptional regulator [Krasilnikovia sp. MM14-A1259]|uniref:LuxR C-terminal-related transcriptional regulator n=1 Tax=Krasilnikovia sp. MM14-A1259 TaxID=3373539 RepID=UPI0038150021
MARRLSSTVLDYAADAPLVGRGAELAALGVAVRGDAGAVLVVGDAGMGKTRLAGECLARHTPPGARALRVLGTRAAATLPLGTLAPLLPRLAVPDAMLLPAARQALLAAGRGRRIILLVDDAHHVDVVSAVLVQQLVTAGKIVALLTARSGQRLPDPLDALWRDGRAVRVELAPIGDEDMQRLAGELLPGGIDLFTARELVHLAAGNPLTLKEIVAAARRDGVLHHETGRGWLATGPIRAPRHVVDVIAERVATLAADQRDALCVVALGEPLERAIAVRLVGTDALDGLEDAGLITVGAGRERCDVRLAHPLFGEAATRDLPTGRRRAWFARLAGALAAAGVRRDDDLVRLADWRLAAAEPGEATLLLGAAKRSLALHDLRSVMRFSAAAHAAGGGAAAAFYLGYAESRTGEFASAEEHLAAAMRAADRPELVSVIGISRSDNLFGGLADWPAATEVIERTERRLTGTPQGDEARAQHARMLWLHGESAAAFETIAALMTVPDSRPWVLGAVLQGVALPWDARPLDALEVAERARPVHDRLWQQEMIQFPPHVHDLGRLFALIFAGRLDEAAELAAGVWADASRTDLVPDLGLLAMLTGYVAKERGRLGEARRWLTRSIEIYERGGPTRIRWPLSLLVDAEVDAGSLAAAHRAAARLRALTDGPIRNTAGMEEIFLARLAAADGHRAQAEAALRSVGHRHQPPGARTIAVYAAHALARIGCPDAGAELAGQLRPHVQGDLLQAKLAFATAAAGGDPERLCAAAESFARLGACPYAAESFGEAALRFTRTGHRRQATRCDNHAQANWQRCDQVRAPALVGAEPAVAPLTSREREIALLAARRLSSREIGERLHLSVRTVDNHLQSCYRKLGISGRSELGDPQVR